MKLVGDAFFGLVVLALCTPSAMAQQAVTVILSPDGDDRGDGSIARPVRSFERAQAIVRKHNKHSDVTVVVSDGVYPLSKPIFFGQPDGGQAEKSVTWKAAAGTRPVLSGGMPVKGWELHDRRQNIYVADIPKGIIARSLYVNGQLFDRPQIEISLRDVTPEASGILIRDPAFADLASIKQPEKMEFVFTGLWTWRISTVSSVERTADGVRLKFNQPSWYNNISSYDTIINNFSKEYTRLFIVNAPEFFGKRFEWGRNDNQWYIDPDAGKLYLKVNEALDVNKLSVILPRLEALVSVAGSHKNPIRNLTIEGLRFSHTSWNGPSSAEGYAPYQSGTYMAGYPTKVPPAPYGTCGRGCPAFNSVREAAYTIPAAFQITAARDITLRGNYFTQLGQIALGIGNDANSVISKVGLGTSNIRVERNRFSEIAGGAIFAGGVNKDAHHPSIQEMTNSNLTIADNVITGVAKQYKDNSAITVTYVDTAQIIHNDISDASYDGVSIGWGWGIYDKGGSRDVAARTKVYDFTPFYDTPTTYRNNLVANNRISGVNQYFRDGGAIYNLSASPGTVIRENYITDVGEAIGVYLDQGSRYIQIERNVIAASNIYLKANTRSPVKFEAPYDRAMPSGGYLNDRTIENTASGNWHSSNIIEGDWLPDIKNIIINDTVVADKDWPEEALAVVAKAGVRPSSQLAAIVAQ
jgi:hypothetical protein